MKRIFTLFLFLCFIGKTFAQQEERIVPFKTQSAILSNNAETDLKQVFNNVKAFQFDLTAFQNYFKISGTSGKFNLSLPNRHLTVSWVEKKLLADDYQLIGLADNGVKKIEESTVKFYEGYILDAPQYSVAITIAPDFINMMIEQPDGNYYIENIEKFSDNIRGAFVYYRAADFIDNKSHTCGLDEAAVENQIHQETANADRAAGVCYKVEVYVASDQLMYNRYGSVAAVEKHTLSVWNNVTTLYKKNFANDYDFKILKQIVATSGGALGVSSTTDASSLLGEFRDWAIKNNGFGDQKFDLAQMWTTRDISGGVVGIAYVGVVCGSSRAQLIEDFSKSSDNLRLVVAHETGHNFNIQHDPAGSPYIMAPSVNPTTTWSSQSKSQLNSFVSGLFSGGTSCLSTCGVPNQKPEVDFTSSTLAVCKGSKIKFTDNSTNDPTSWVWTFPGGTPAQSISESPEVVYSTPGVYDVTLKATNAAGANTITKKQLIFVGETSGNYCKSPATQNTKAGIRFFKIANMANTSGSAQQDGNKYKDFSCTNIATLQPNTAYDCELAVGDCDSKTYEIVQLYADYNNDNDFDDLGEFIGYSSFAYCGSFTFKMTTPPSPIENKLLRLRVISSKGTDITLDPCLTPTEGQIEDYGILFQCPISCASKDPVANFTTLSNTVCKGAALKFTDRSQYNPFKWEWSFPGGTPSSSTEENPMVTYNADGVYDVTLKVTNTKGISIIEKKKYISVSTVANNYCNTPAVLNTKAGIKSFKLANLFNKTGSAQQDGNRYMDFSCTHIATLQANTSYDIELEIGDCPSKLNEAYRIYIDYNNDGDFLDQGEQIANNNAVLSCGLLTYNSTSFKNLRFTTPGNVIEGTVLRLRVITQSSIITGNDSTNPCYNPTDGQVEDYGVLFKAGAFSFNSTVKNVSCNGYNDGNIKINLSGGKTPYSFDWNVNTYDGESEAKNLKAGDYSVTVTDGDGFNIIRKFTLTQPDSTVYGVLKNHAQCSQPTGNIELAPVGGGNGGPFTFAWNHNPDEKTNKVENLYGGTYVVTITDGKGCRKEVIIPLDSTVMPNLSGLRDTIVCKGQSVTLTAKGGLKYKWSTGATTPSITVTTDGKYFVTATNGECETNTSANVGFIDFKPEITGDNSVCQGNQAFLIASGAIDYLWNTGETGTTISAFPQVTTKYSVTASYSGCSKTVDWTISVTTTSGVTINASKSEICAGEAVILSSSDGKSYTWSNGQVGKSITVNPSATTTYSFLIPTIKCPEDFKVAKEIKVGSGISNPTVQVLGSTTFCQGSSVTLIAPPNLSYKWSNGATTQSIDATIAGSYVVTVTKDACSGVSSPVAVTVTPRPTPTITSPSGITAICDGANLKLDAPAGFDVYLWSNNEFGQSTKVTQSGTYSVTVVDSKGCIGVSAPFVVNSSAKPAATASADVTICSGASTSLNVSASGTSSPYTFNWGPNAGLSSTNTAATIASPTITTTYVVTVTDSKGCYGTDNVIVNVLSKPSVNVGSDISICAGSSATLNTTISNGNPPYIYGWSPTTGLSSGNVSNPVVTPISTTTYILSVTDNKGCIGSDNIIVSVIPLPPVPTISVNKNTLSSSAASGNQWFLNGQPIAGATNQTYNITKDGNYSVKVTSSQGNCSSISTSLSVKYVAIKDLLDEQAFKVFPNPMENFIVVKINAPLVKYLEMTDVAGRIIAKLELISAEQFEQTINTSSWHNGMYFIYVKNKDNEVIGVRQVVKI